MAGRTKKAFNNLFFGVINLLIRTLFPFFIRKMFVQIIGMEYLGLTNFCNSIIGVLNLADLGFGGVVVYCMYKPASEGNLKEMGRYLNYIKKTYNLVGIIILFSGIVIMPFLKYFIHDAPPQGINIYLVFSIFLINSVISYCLYAYKYSILNVFQRLDVENNLCSFFNILTYILEILILLFIKNYYSYIGILPIITMLLNITRAKIVDHYYPELKCEGTLSKQEKTIFIKKLTATFFFKIDSIVITMADSIVISSFLGLLVLAKYNNYFLILNSVAGFLSVIKGSIQPSIGNSIVTENVEKNYSDLKFLLFVFFWILCFCSSCFLCLYQPFIEIWLGKESLLPFSTVICIVIYFYSWYSSTPVNIYKDANGFWTEDRFRPLIEAPFNLILNIILIKIIGLNGVLLSTAITLGFISLPVVYWVMNKYYFIGKGKEYSILTLKYLAYAIFINIVTFFICNKLNLPNWPKFIISFLISTFLSFIFFPLPFINSEEFARCILLLKKLFCKFKK